MVDEALANITSCWLGSALAPASTALPASETSGKAPGSTMSVVFVLDWRTPWVTVSEIKYCAPPAVPASCTRCAAVAPKDCRVPSRAAHDGSAPSRRMQLQAKPSSLNGAPSGSYDDEALSGTGVSPTTPPPPLMSATSGEGTTKKDSEPEPQVVAAPAKQANIVNVAVWLAPRVRAGRKSVGDRADATESGAPAPSVALVCQVNVKPPATLHLSPSTGVTEPPNEVSAERAVELPAKPGVTSICSMHRAQVRPSPAMPTGQGPQLEVVAHDTPA
jgi:hypothetical protein